MINKKDGLTDIARPYEKCLRLGAASLTDAELLAVIIRTGTRGCDSVKLAERVLRLRGGDGGSGILSKITVPELLTLEGIGEVKAIQICCVGEISRRISRTLTRSRIKAADPKSVAEYYMEMLRHDEQENICCMMLDAKNHIIGEDLISRGTACASLLSARDLFMTAIRYRAVNIILIHNHPSGDPAPSEEDIFLTSRIAEAGQLLDIHLIDHIVIGDRCYISFRESGLMSDGSVNV